MAILEVGGKRYGGWTDVARELGLYHLVDQERSTGDGGVTVVSERVPSRQRVYGWYQRRHLNGFPERYLIEGGGHLFDLDEVRAWHARYRPRPGGRPGRSGRPRRAPAK